LVGAYLYGSEDRAEVLPLYRSDYRVPN
jgi:hypothetical protein